MDEPKLKVLQGGLLEQMRRVMLGKSHEDAERFVQTVERRASLKAVPGDAVRGSEPGNPGPTSPP